ncbi:Syntaxin-16 [Tritrichomonas musculus]|uniref:Syntaxin-16 n=1 Tax=Tritrichomonas musculus TaxID=1915356 RepID=A0ABR2K7D6_9EUKA
MYLPVSGANRDRTTDMMRYRGNTIKTNYNAKNQTIQSPLETYFELFQEIKTQINRLEINFDNLVRKQQECLRPTFADSSDLVNQINSLTNSINSKLLTISQQINTIQYRENEFSNQNENAIGNNIINKDREQILKNLKTNLYNLSEEFSFKFQTSQHAFLASFHRSSNFKTDDNNNNDDNKELKSYDFSSLKKMNDNNDQQAYFMEQQQIQRRQTEEIAQITQREQEIRGLFLNLSNLIIQQGSIIDRIDYCVSESLQNAETAHKEVEKAAEYQKKSRMWKCAIFLSVFVVVLLILALLK